MASLATVSQDQHRTVDTVSYPLLDRQKTILSTWSDYSDDGTQNGILHLKNDNFIDDDSSLQRHNDVNTSILPKSGINNNNIETIDDCEVYLHNSQDFYQEGFLEKFRQLRMAHKQTLESWQKLYEEKHPVKLTTSSNYVEYPVHKVDIEYDEEEPIENIHCGSGIAVDTRTFPRKIPVSPRRKSEGSFKNKPMKKNIENKSWLKDPNIRQHSCYAHAHHNFEKDTYKEFMTPTRPLQNEGFLSSSVNNIKAGFSEKPGLDYSFGLNSFPIYDVENYDDQDDGSWQHRLTIPKPFNMTIREEINQKKKSRSLLEYEKECEEKRRIEEEECQKMFKATPVPDHVFMPRYEDIRKKNEMRRSLVKEQTKELLRSQEKPFSFTRIHWDDEKEEEEIREQYNENLAEEIQEIEKRNMIKANPIPKHILDSLIDEKLKSDAKLREVKRKLRSFELLRSSYTPKGMEFRQKLMEQKLESKSKEIERKTKKHNPKIHYDLPDYDALYKQFQKELMKKKKVIENTNVQPFTFRTDELVKERRMKQAWKEESQDGSESRFGKLCKSKSFPDYLHTIPAKTTTSTQLRMQANREKITKQKINSAKTKTMLKPKDDFLKKEIQQKISPGNEKSKNVKSTPKYREQQKNYSRQLQEMQERLKQRPLLFEQVEKNNVKSRVEKRFKETLRNFGIDESFVTEDLFTPQKSSFPQSRSTDFSYQESNDAEAFSEKQDTTRVD